MTPTPTTPTPTQTQANQTSPADIAEGLARQTLQELVSPGGIRVASQEEEKAARCFWKVVENLNELESQLSNHPETSVLLQSERPLAIIKQIITRAGAAGRCKILVARPQPSACA